MINDNKKHLNFHCVKHKSKRRQQNCSFTTHFSVTMNDNEGTRSKGEMTRVRADKRADERGGEGGK